MGDYDNIINTAVEDAEKRGEAKGRAEGREEGLVEAARNFLALGVDIETISKATGLDVEDVETLKDK